MASAGLLSFHAAIRQSHDMTRGKKGAPKRAAAAGSTATSRLNVILERVEEQQRVVIEAVTSNREALERKIEEGNLKLASRIDTLELVVRQNSEDIRKNSEDLRSLSDKLDAKADSTRVTALEARVDALEI